DPAYALRRQPVEDRGPCGGERGLSVECFTGTVGYPVQYQEEHLLCNHREEVRSRTRLFFPVEGHRVSSSRSRRPASFTRHRSAWRSASFARVSPRSRHSSSQPIMMRILVVLIISAERHRISTARSSPTIASVSQ